MNKGEILRWLQEKDPKRLDVLWTLADQARRVFVGDAVHIRGLIEFSNHCRSACHHCGMRSERISLFRYRMTAEEIMASAKEAVARGYGAIVMQSGEDPSLDIEWLADVVRAVKRETPLAITLSCGERSEEELQRWREAGADRYYLRFETSDRLLWKKIHPTKAAGEVHRLDILPRIREMGYETGSGVMVGIPGQTWSSLVEDIRWFQCLDLDMIGCGPYVPHKETPLGEGRSDDADPTLGGEQVPNTNLVCYKVMALTRLLCPNANIPTTTAVATLNRENGSRLGLQRGANVLMVNLTPPQYRHLYEIYPSKAGIVESDQAQLERVSLLLAGLGRTQGDGPGASPNFEARRRSETSSIEG